MSRRQYWAVLLTSVDRTKGYLGRHKSVVLARNNARALATEDGSDPETLEEVVYDLVGPAPRTFAGNPWPMP